MQATTTTAQTTRPRQKAGARLFVVRPRLRCGRRRPRSRMGARVRLQCAPGADRRDPGGIGRPAGGRRRPAPARRNRAHRRLRRAARLQPAPVPLLRLAPAAPMRADRAAHLHHARKSRAPAGRGRSRQRSPPGADRPLQPVLPQAGGRAAQLLRAIVRRRRRPVDVPIEDMPLARGKRSAARLESGLRAHLRRVLFPGQLQCLRPES